MVSAELSCCLQGWWTVRDARNARYRATGVLRDVEASRWVGIL